MAALEAHQARGLLAQGAPADQLTAVYQTGIDEGDHTERYHGQASRLQTTPVS